MKKVFGICDLDKSYVEVLTRYISNKEGSYFNVVGFSKPEALADFIVREKFSVLLISVSFIEELNSFSASKDVVPEKTYILTEELEPGGFKYPEVYKYQSTEAILRQIINDVKKVDVSGLKNLTGSFITGIYSPLGRCGKTTAALRTAKKYSSTEKTMLLSFDRYPSLLEFNKKDGHAGISDLLYLSATDDIASLGSSYLVSGVDGVDVILRSNCSEDIYGFSEEDIASFASDIKTIGYQRIVIDVGNDIRKPEELLRLCDEILVPVLDDEASLRKLKAWEKETKEIYGSGMFEKMRKISL